ncbi:hypothetical protein [Micromonospora chalcea]|uniref:hypothetical protein n=1 Tax=Micromonospora chalcea TaxID=1874 RepID=UPI0038F6DBDE
MSVLWFQIRNSPVRMAVFPLAVLDIAVVFLRSRFWFGVWPDTGAAAQIPTYLLGLIVAACAAWAADAPLRHNMQEQIKAAAISPARLEGLRLVATALILSLPYLVGQAVAFSLTARTFPPGVHLWFGYFLVGLFVTILSVVIGWACGKFIGTTFGAVVAALGWLLLVALSSNVSDFVVMSGSPEVTVDLVAIVTRLALIAAIFVVFIVVPVVGRPSRRVALALISTAVSLGIVLTATSTVVQRKAPASASCVSGRIKLCVWPEHEKYLPSLTSVGERVEVLPGVFAVPPQMNEFGIDPVKIIRKNGTVGVIESPNMAPSFRVIEGSRWSYSGEIAKAILVHTYRKFGRCRWDAISSTDQERSLALDAWMETYLAGGGRPDYRTNAPAEVKDSWEVGRRIANEELVEFQFRWAEEAVVELGTRYCR